MSVPVLFVAGAVVAAVLVLAAAMPRALLTRAQDRLARQLLAETGASFKLLTRAELSTGGAYRRLPGVLGLTENALVFHGLFGETETVPTARIQKIVTGTRLASGRQLLGREVLRVEGAGGGGLEVVLARASAAAWRSHLGLWAVAERTSSMNQVTPGR
ncbi:MAG TPA: hypothetical protein VGG65_10430 [Thermoanaerobaculia bacterium]